MATIYVTEQPKAGKPIIGWNKEAMKVEHTTPVVCITAVDDRTWDITTQYGQVQATTKR